MVCKKLIAVCLVALFTAYSSSVFSTYYKGLLWEISRGEAPPSYVFGTFHSSDDEILNLPVSVRKALHQSSVLVVEMTLDEKSLGLFRKAAVLPDENNLKGVMNDNLLYSEAISSMAQRGSPREMTRRLKPWAIYMNLNKPGSENEGMIQDSLLQFLAGLQNKPVASLERPQEQIRVYDDLSYGEQTEMLEDLLDGIERERMVYREVKQHYLQRSLGKMADIASYQNSGLNHSLKSKLQQRLVVRRNQTMVGRMENYLQKGNAFIAIGALHLPGDRGILNQLAENGYSVRRVY